jgi:hypothetical protein
MSIHVHRWPPLPHSPHRQPSPFLFLPRLEGRPRPRRGDTRHRPRLLLLRLLPFRLRSQDRSLTPHPRRDPRGGKTPNRPYRRLLGANPHASHPHLPARIQQRLQHRRLAQSHQPLRQRQPRLPLLARPRRRPTRTSATRSFSAAPTHTPPTQPPANTQPTRPHSPPAQSAEPTINPAAQTLQQAPPTKQRSTQTDQINHPALTAPPRPQPRLATPHRDPTPYTSTSTTASAPTDSGIKIEPS